MRKWPDPDYHIAQTCKVKLTGRLNPAGKRESWLIEDVASRHPHPSSPLRGHPVYGAVRENRIFHTRWNVEWFVEHCFPVNPKTFRNV